LPHGGVSLTVSVVARFDAFTDALGAKKTGASYRVIFRRPGCLGETL